MARPSVVGFGAIAANTSGNLSPAIPTHQANDILLARVSYWGPNTAGDALDIPTPASWTILGSQGGGSDARHTAFWFRATGAGHTVTFTRGVSWDTGTDTKYFARTAVIRNCRTSGNPYDQESTQGTESSSNAIVLAMTGGADRLQMLMMGVTDDISAPSYSGHTVDHATSATDMGGAIAFLYKDTDGNEAGGNMTSGAPAQGNYTVRQIMLRPQTITGAAIVMPLLLDRVVSGAYTRRGAVVLNLTLDRFVHAWQQHYGAVAMPMTFERVVSGQSVKFGRAAGLTFSINRVVQGTYTRRGVVSLDLNLDRTVIGRGSFHAIAQGLDMTIGIVTVGALPLALGVLTEGSLDLIPLDPEDAQTLLALSPDSQTLAELVEDSQTLQALTEASSLFLDPLNEIQGA